MTNSADFSSVAGVTVGDIVIIEDTVDYSYSAHRANYHLGEYLVVKDVSGNTLTFDSASTTTYIASATVKLYKLNHVECNISGCNFISDQSDYGLLLSNVSRGDISPSLIRNGGIGSKAALQLDRCYDCTVNTRAEKDYQGAGTDYGVAIVNSQNITVLDSICHGGRHGVSTGGDANPAAVPCRNIHVKRCKISNDPTAGIYAADFHGNTIDSTYEDCFISNSIGLAGENTTATNCIVYQGSYGIPLAYHEVVSGDISFNRCVVRCSSSAIATSAAVVGNPSSAIADNIEDSYRIVVEDLDLSLDSQNALIFNGYISTAIGVEYYYNNIRVKGNASGLTQIMRSTVTGPGIYPTSITIDNFKLRGLSNSVELLNLNGTHTGTLVTLPEFTKTENVTIGIGGYISNTLVHNHPIFPVVPQNFLSSSGESLGGPGYAHPLNPAVRTVSQATSVVTTGMAVHTFSVAKTYTLSSVVTLRNYVI
jgi:hypothetical protein